MQLNISRINNPKVIQILKAINSVASNPVLKEKNYKLYIVGGFIRDYLYEEFFPNEVKKDSKSLPDIDVMIAEKDGDYLDIIMVSDMLADALGASRNHNVSHQGTVTLTDNDGYSVDVAVAREDTYSDESRQADIKATTFEKDAFRRDFTINSLSLEMGTMEIKDPTNYGIIDLKNKYIRTPLDPFQTFMDDPLRILRAIRFKNKFGFEFDPSIMKTLKDESKMEELLERFKVKVAPERMLKEFKKILEQKGSGDAIKDLQWMGILGQYDDIISDLIDDKSVSILNNVDENLDESQKIVIWLSNLRGKEQIDKVSKIVDKVLRKLKHNNDTIKNVRTILEQLFNMPQKYEGMDSTSIREKIRLFKGYADKIITVMKKLYEGYEQFEEDVKLEGGIESIQEPLKITGDDLISLGLKPGKAIGQALKDVERITKIQRLMNEDELLSKLKLNELTIDNDTGKILDNQGNKIVASIKIKLNRIANVLDAIGMVKEADEVDEIKENSEVKQNTKERYEQLQATPAGERTEQINKDEYDWFVHCLYSEYIAFDKESFLRFISLFYKYYHLIPADDVKTYMNKLINDYGYSFVDKLGVGKAFEIFITLRNNYGIALPIKLIIGYELGSKLKGASFEELYIIEKFFELYKQDHGGNLPIYNDSVVGLYLNNKNVVESNAEYLPIIVQVAQETRKKYYENSVDLNTKKSDEEAFKKVLEYMSNFAIAGRKGDEESLQKMIDIYGSNNISEDVRDLAAQGIDGIYFGYLQSAKNLEEFVKILEQVISIIGNKEPFGKYSGVLVDSRIGGALESIDNSMYDVKSLDKLFKIVISSPGLREKLSESINEWIKKTNKIILLGDDDDEKIGSEEAKKALLDNFGIINKTILNDSDKLLLGDVFQYIVELGNSYDSVRLIGFLNVVAASFKANKKDRQSAQDIMNIIIGYSDNNLNVASNILNKLKERNPKVFTMKSMLGYSEEDYKDFLKTMKLEDNRRETDYGSFIEDPRIEITAKSRSDLEKLLNRAYLNPADRDIIVNELDEYISYMHYRVQRTKDTIYEMGAEGYEFNTYNISQELGFDPDEAKGIMEALQNTIAKGNKLSVEILNKWKSELKETADFNPAAYIVSESVEEAGDVIEEVNEFKPTRDYLAQTYGLYAENKPVNLLYRNTEQIEEIFGGERSFVKAFGKGLSFLIEDFIRQFNLPEEVTEKFINMAFDNSIREAISYLGQLGYGKGKDNLTGSILRMLKGIFDRMPKTEEAVMKAGAPIDPMEFVMKVQEKPSPLRGGGFYVNLVPTNNMFKKMIRLLESKGIDKPKAEILRAQEHKHYFDKDSQYTLCFARIVNKGDGWFVIVLQNDLWANNEHLRNMMNGWEYYLIDAVKRLAVATGKKIYMITDDGEARLWPSISDSILNKTYKAVPENMQMEKVKFHNEYDSYAYKVAMRLNRIANGLDKFGYVDEASKIDCILNNILK